MLFSERKCFKSNLHGSRGSWRRAHQLSRCPALRLWSMQLTHALHELMASHGEGAFCHMLHASSRKRCLIRFLPLLFSPGLPDTPGTPFTSAALKYLKACPQRRACQYTLPTCQYFPGVLVVLVFPRDFLSYKPPLKSTANFDAAALISLVWAGVHEHSPGWPQVSSICSGLLEMRTFSSTCGHDTLPTLYLHMKTASLPPYTTHWFLQSLFQYYLRAARPGQW